MSSLEVSTFDTLSIRREGNFGTHDVQIWAVAYFTVIIETESIMVIIQDFSTRKTVIFEISHNN